MLLDCRTVSFTYREMFMKNRLLRLVCSALLVTSVHLHAQPFRPELTLIVDANEATRKILHVRQSLPVHEGEMTLYYPKWIPGEHGPTGPVVDLVGLRLSANAQAMPWRRDPEDMYAFHCNVPPQVNMLDVAFDFVLPSGSGQFSSGPSSTAHLLLLSWNQVVLYPKHMHPDSLTVTPRLILPKGWQFSSALDVEGEANNEIRFKPVSLTKLIDSPLLAGRFFKRIDLGIVNGRRHFLNMASDGEEAFRMPDTLVAAYRRLVREGNALFGAPHYDRYEFLFTLSDYTAHFGLEHHQSSDNRVPERSLHDYALRVTTAGLLPHEFVHSWNGKYRRPAGLATGDFSTPMRGELLWVYEGLTQYLGNILTARSGLRTPEEYREHLALTAASLDTRPGRAWRSLQETADAAQMLFGARKEWESLRRRVDFYDEGNLIWLEADAIIRQETKGKKSLDDFCKLFHGGSASGPLLKPYMFEEIVAALNQVARYDWNAMLTERLQSLSPRAPLLGIERAGWKLVYRDTLSNMARAFDERSKSIDMRFSLGILFDEEGTMLDVIPGMAGAKAGLAPCMKLVAINGRKFSKYTVREAVRVSASTKQPLEMLVENAGYFTAYQVDYHGGERYPFLERDSTKPDLLSRIIQPTVRER
jgi:predicted metalloprotease with PDZ domain